MSKKFSSFVSFLLLFAMTAPLSFTHAFATHVVNSDSSVKTVPVLLDGRTVTYHIIQNAEQRIVRFEEDGMIHEASYDLSSGVLLFDGQIISVLAPVDDFTGYHTSSYDADAKWVLYDTSYGDLTTGILSVAAWTSILLAFMGAPLPVLTELATLLVENELPTVYYKKYMYYKGPVTTSRPQNANMYVFYEDPEYEIYLMTIDLRPELN